MSPASYVTSEMKTNIAQRKKKSPPSSLSFSRTGTFDARGSLFLPMQAPRSIGSRSTPPNPYSSILNCIGPAGAGPLLFSARRRRGPGQDGDADRDAIQGEG